MKVRKGVFLVAGLGTRTLPAAKSVPKVMLPLADKPAIQYVVEEAVAAGIEQVILVTATGNQAVEDYFDTAYRLEESLAARGKRTELAELQALKEMATVIGVRQHAPLGTGDAVRTARSVVGDEPFAVFLPDDVIDGNPPAIKQLIDAHETYGGEVVAVMPVPHAHVDRYGIVEGTHVAAGIQRLHRLIEKPPADEAPSNLAIVGRYVFTPAIFDFIDRIPVGSGGEVQITDAINSLAQAGSVYSCEFTGKRYDMGDKVGYLSASIDLALKRPDLRPGLLAYLRSLDLDHLDTAT
ncbi:MAG: UTP--glucose-1-phosphate uridylyltransferase [Chloroflexi bacterium]|nr:UTP--glucose-1-phosphate uridylyltransferase [Chloroflexota bacterium]